LEWKGKRKDARKSDAGFSDFAWETFPAHIAMQSVENLLTSCFQKTNRCIKS
jgi:hypothetical protein